MFYPKFDENKIFIPAFFFVKLADSKIFVDNRFY